MTPEEIQAAFVAQLEFNRQIQQQGTQSRQVIAELTAFTAQNSQAIAELTRDTAQSWQMIVELGHNVQAVSRDVAQLVTAQEEAARERAELSVGLDRLTNLTERYINASTAVVDRLERNILELRAGQEQQARVLDYLLQKEEKRQGEGEG